MAAAMWHVVARWPAASTSYFHRGAACVVCFSSGIKHHSRLHLRPAVTCSAFPQREDACKLKLEPRHPLFPVLCTHSTTRCIAATAVGTRQRYIHLGLHFASHCCLRPLRISPLLPLVLDPPSHPRHPSRVLSPPPPLRNKFQAQHLDTPCRASPSRLADRAICLPSHTGPASAHFFVRPAPA